MPQVLTARRSLLTSFLSLLGLAATPANAAPAGPSAIGGSGAKDQAADIAYTLPKKGAQPATVFERMTRSVTLYDFLSDAQRGQCSDGSIAEDLSAAFVAAAEAAGPNRTLVIPDIAQKLSFKAPLTINNGAACKDLVCDAGRGTRLDFTGLSPAQDCLTMADHAHGSLKGVYINANKSGRAGIRIYSAGGFQMPYAEDLYVFASGYEAFRFEAANGGWIQSGTFNRLEADYSGESAFKLIFTGATGTPFINECEFSQLVAHRVSRLHNGGHAIRFDGGGLKGGSETKFASNNFRHTTFDAWYAKGDPFAPAPDVIAAVNGANVENPKFDGGGWENSAGGSLGGYALKDISGHVTDISGFDHGNWGSGSDGQIYGYSPFPAWQRNPYADFGYKASIQGAANATPHIFFRPSQQGGSLDPGINVEIWMLAATNGGNPSYAYWEVAALLFATGGMTRLQAGGNDKVAFSYDGTNIRFTQSTGAPVDYQLVAKRLM